jgi:hypothetical protein
MKHPWNLPARFLRRLKTTGPGDTLSFVSHLLRERYHDARLGIRTTGKVFPAAYVRRPDLYQPYAPTAYRNFRAAMRHISIRPGADVFVDYGAGKGRVVVLAAECPFRRVLGVEISPELSEIARANVQRAARRLRCRDVKIITADAADFGCPDDATVLYFFDPFAGVVLERVLEHVKTSLIARPRPLQILFADPNHMAPLAERCDWLRRRAVIPYEVVSGKEPIRESFHIYEAACLPERRR